MLPGSHYPAPVYRHPVPGSRYPAPVYRHPVPGSRYPAPVYRHPVPGSHYPAPVDDRLAPVDGSRVRRKGAQLPGYCLLVSVRLAAGD